MPLGRYKPGCTPNSLILLQMNIQIPLPFRIKHFYTMKNEVITSFFLMICGVVTSQNITNEQFNTRCKVAASGLQQK